MYHLPYQVQLRATVDNREAVAMEVEQQLEAVVLTV